VAFRTSLLNLVKLFSALTIHLFFVCILLAILICYKVPLTLHAIQLPYYMLSSLILLTGLTWITSALAVFAKDVLHIIGASVGLLFWLTPLVWDASTVSPKWRLLLSFNPFWYITDGFRDSLVFQHWFWEGDGLLRTGIFWAITGALFITGGLVFRRLRPHFADVL
jgi:lipopolysaccharide transport system permease protein/teichoic acid transport system permease protein